MFSQPLNKNLLIALALAPALLSCDSEDEDKKPVVGDSFFETNISKVSKDERESMVKAFAASIPSKTDGNYWPRSGYFPGENLSFSDKGEYDSASIGAKPKQGLDITSAPIVAEDKVFTLSGDGELQARKLSDISELVWSTQVKETEKKKKKEDGYVEKAMKIFSEKTEFLGGNICYSQGVIYVGTKRGYVVALNAGDGKVMWSKYIGAQIRSTPVSALDIVAFTTTDNRTIAVSAANGEQKWQHQSMADKAKVMASPAPVLVNDKLVVTYSSGEIYELNFATGAEVWSATAATSAYGRISSYSSDISQTPVSHNNSLYVVSSDGTLNAIDANGNSKWAFEGEAINRAPWPVKDFLFTTTKDGELLAISASSGKLVWKKRIATDEDISEDNKQFTGVVMINGLLYTADNLGTLHAFSPVDGKQEKEIDIPDAVYLTPVVADNKILLLTKEAELIAVE